MLAPDEKVLKALLNLECSPDYEVVFEWLSDSYDNRLKENSELLDETRLRWGQGRAQLLSDLLNTIRNARELYLLKKK